ncbi:MAG: HAMP domain-containing histidine kinase [Bacteroidetes bacterium]|nr:HAMP domain-containing histidine kinase [Bacteroidota bacterium]MBK8144425.1 HAMP domain-containing histidine kinase [Bacteroidota bacterium]
MKKIFPVIIALIVVSLLGLIYLQVDWISGTMKLKREQYDHDIHSSFNEIRTAINKRKDKSILGFSIRFQPMSFGNYIPTNTVIKDYEMKELIKTEFKKHNIKQPFEYCIRNEMSDYLMFSSGFKNEYFESENIYTSLLTQDGYVNSEMLYVYIEPDNYFQNHLAILLLFAALFTSVIIAAFVLTLKTMLSQNKLSEIKSDFINNMTHEFKTPIATIQLATDALNNDKVISNQQQIKYYSSIIKEENRRMNKQVEKILQAAQLEKDEIKLQYKKINVHDILTKVAEYTKLQMEEIGATFTLHLTAQQYIINADEVHFTNIIFNLVDNATKYSNENPIIDISTSNADGAIQIHIKDNGIGMDKETQNHIFEKFYRAHTGNLHNVKGFGLGLTYVKNIVDAHSGKISVYSELGKGSTFTLTFSIA